jgi:hypothetical protein
VGPFSHEDDLEELRHHWDTAYSILHNRDGFQAKRKDGRGEWIIRQTADELFAAISEDYIKRPVPRDEDES